MNENDFDLLCESIRQAGEIRSRVRKPSRTFVVEDPNPKAIRERLGLSQSRFASIIGVSVRTLQNWEQGRREPEGPAKALLRVVDREPQAVIVEYTGNKHVVSGSTGEAKDANLGYGISGGQGFVWVCMPYVEKGRLTNALTWWGDRQATRAQHSPRAM